MSVACPADQVSFPVSGDRTVFSLCWTLSDRDGVLDLTVLLYEGRDVILRALEEDRL